MLRIDENGTVFDDGIPSWVDTTPQALQNPDVTSAEIAAYRTARSVKGHGLPVADDRYSWLGPKDPVRPSYIMEPTLEEAQGGMQLPTGLMQNDDGSFYYGDTGQNVPVVRRPGLLPIANTPEGYKFATPKLLDLVGNVMGNVGGPLKVAAKGNEMVLGAGMVRKMPEWDIKGFEGQDWFHGTTHEFEKFSKAKGNPENHLGQYPHFTTSPEDAAANYAGHGPDLTGRIERRADELMSDFDYDKFTKDREHLAEKIYGKPYDHLLDSQQQEIRKSANALQEIDPVRAKQQATKELAGPHEGAIIPAKMKLQNPVSLVEDKPTWLDFNAKYDKDGEWVKDSPLMTKLLNSFKKQGEKYNFDGQKAFDDVAEKASLYDGEVKASALNKAMRESDVLQYVDNDKGNLIGSHIVSEVFKDLGFDGIVMDAKQAFPGMKNIPEGTLHAVPLKQNTVKGKYNDKVLFSDTKGAVAAQAAKQVEKGPFYSTLERAVGDAKINLATPEQWLGYLKNQPGVKAEELNTVLKDLPKEGMLSKQQLDEFVKTNKVELKEKVLGGETSDLYKRRDILQTQLRNEKNLDKRSDIVIEIEKINNKLDNEVGKNSVTKYHSYQLPGGENYKEMLLSLPEKNGFKVVPNPEGKGFSIKYPDGTYQTGFGDKPASWATEHLAENTGMEYVKSNARGKLVDKLRQKYGDNFADNWNDAEKREYEAINKSSNKYQAPHFDEHGTNLLAHVRMNDRYLPKDGVTRTQYTLKRNGEAIAVGDDIAAKRWESNKQAGDEIISKVVKDKNAKEKLLHLEEIQSDWHQQGRKQGYVGEKEKLQPEFDKIEEKLMATNDEKMLGLPKVEDVLKEAVDKKIITKNEADTYKRFTDIENSKPVPDAPFKKNWDELALKRMLHKAANEGYDALSWTPGEAQAARYDLSKQVESVRARRNKDGSYKLDAVTKEGNDIPIGNNIDKNKLLDHVGKDLSDKILKENSNDKWYEGADLKIGGEGMRSFYDKMLVDKANAIAKKYGSKVEQKSIGESPEAAKKKFDDFLNSMREEAKTFYLGENYTEAEKQTALKMGKRLSETTDEERLVKVLGKTTKWRELDSNVRNAERGYQPIHYLPITPELREKAKSGFPLFSSVPTTIPVDYQPQFEDKKSKYKLVPVEGNPFQ